ncbi:MAG: Y-family DNA polymerase, partial [Candidatus Methanomethylophilaceae archaeon]|nr:Y-family DNA polymerase [Candidatus Methanomethylophilaceae archaeon]
NNDGCAVARSNEAKALGIRMGDPLFKIRDIVEKNDVAVFSGNFALYGDMSRRVQEVLRGYSPSVEVYSIDEAFLDLDGIDADYDAYAKEISRECWRRTSIPVSVGIAPTKTLAKIASKLCKRYPKLRGGCYMHRREDIEKVLRKFPAEDVWGIGRRMMRKLESMGVQTAWDYASLPETTVRMLFHLPGYRTWKELRGIPCIALEDMIEPRKTICVSRSFSKEITDCNDLCEQVANFAESAVGKLRAQGSVALEIVVFALTNRFRENAPQTCASRLVVIPDGTSDHRTFIRAALEGCRGLYDPRYAYKKAGVVITKLVQEEGFSQSLFADQDALEKESRLSSSIDSINKLYGRGAVLLGSQGTGEIRMSREHQSPHYTTLWADIPKTSVH